MEISYLINKIIFYSKLYNSLIIVKNRLEKEIRLVNSLPIRSDEISKTINNAIYSLKLRISEVNQASKMILLNLFNGRDFGFSDKWVFSSKELLEGYAELLLVKEKYPDGTPKGDQERYILLFRDCTINTNPVSILPKGTIVQKNKHWPGNMNYNIHVPIDKDYISIIDKFSLFDKDLPF